MLRIELAIPGGEPPKVTSQTVIANGFGQRADKDVFLIGPTGLALIGNTLYVSDALENRIVAIADAPTRSAAPAPGATVTKDGLLQRPLALAATATATSSPATARTARWSNSIRRRASNSRPNGSIPTRRNRRPATATCSASPWRRTASGFYYVEDDMNMLAKATP